MATQHAEKQSTATPGKQGTVWKIAAVILAIGLIIALAKVFHVQALLQSALEWIKSLGKGGMVAFIIIYIGACLLCLPASILTLGAGAVYGVVQGSILVSIASTLGATAAFLVGRYAARGWVERKTRGNQKFQAIDEAVAREGWKIVGLTRLSPLFPFTLLNYAYGVTKVKLSHYVLASWIGMMPGTVAYIYLGSLAGNLAQGGASKLQWAIRIVGFIATVVVTVYVTRLASQALRQKVTV